MSKIRSTALKHPLRFAVGIGINASGAAVLLGGLAEKLGNWVS